MSSLDRGGGGGGGGGEEADDPAVNIELDSLSFKFQVIDDAKNAPSLDNTIINNSNTNTINSFVFIDHDTSNETTSLLDNTAAAAAAVSNDNNKANCASNPIAASPNKKRRMSPRPKLVSEPTPTITTADCLSDEYEVKSHELLTDIQQSFKNIQQKMQARSDQDDGHHHHLYHNTSLLHHLHMRNVTLDVEPANGASAAGGGGTTSRKQIHFDVATTNKRTLSETSEKLMVSTSLLETLNKLKSEEIKKRSVDGFLNGSLGGGGSRLGAPGPGGAGGGSGSRKAFCCHFLTSRVRAWCARVHHVRKFDQKWRRMQASVFNLLERPSGAKGFFYRLLIFTIILGSIITGALTSLKSLDKWSYSLFFWYEISMTMYFSVEYLLRLWSCAHLTSYQVAAAHICIFMPSFTFQIYFFSIKIDLEIKFAFAYRFFFSRPWFLRHKVSQNVSCIG